MKLNAAFTVEKTEGAVPRRGDAVVTRFHEEV